MFVVLVVVVFCCFFVCVFFFFFFFFFFTFLLLNQEHGVNKERSQSIQSVRHSKRTHRMWPRRKDRSTRKGGGEERGGEERTKSVSSA